MTREFGCGAIAASSTGADRAANLVLIINADQLGRSVGDMYTGAIIPALILTGLYMLYIFL
jgi:TRAP-type mannitol/chloroaromatic compound transport system permease large subunit